MGGDQYGAQQVNLIQGEKPSDIYSAVATSVAKLVAQEAEQDNPLAKLVDGHIVRKLVKHVVGLVLSYYHHTVSLTFCA